MLYINNKKIILKRYSSGELKLFHNTLLDPVKKNTANILYVCNSKLTMFELMIIINYYQQKNILVNLTLSYLPYQRMDREGKSSVGTLKNVCGLLNALNLNSILVCEPHSDISYLNNATSVSYVNLLSQKVFNEINFNPNQDILFFTDEGGKKRYGHLSKNALYSKKIRNKETGLIESLKIIGDVTPGQKIVLVDDIISTGDTIVHALEELKKITDEKVYILSGHFEKNKYNKRLIESQQVIKIFSTNSINKTKNKKIKLYDVSELLNTAQKCC